MSLFDHLDFAAFQLLVQPYFTTLVKLSASFLPTYGGQLLNVVVAFLSTLNGRTPDFYNQDIPLVSPSMLLESYDYIVIGGGIAGCLMSKRLAAANYTTLLIHGPGSLPNALPRVPLFNALLHGNPEHDFSYDGPYIPQTHWRNHTPRYSSGTDLGGSAVLSAQMWSYGKKGDYRSWKDLYNLSPDFDYANLRKFGEKHEDAATEINGTDFAYGREGEIQVRFSPTWSPFARLQNLFEETAARVTQTAIVEDHNSNALGFGKIITAVEHRRNTSYISTPTRAFFEGDVPEKLHILTEHMVQKILFDTSVQPPKANGVQFISVAHSFFEPKQLSAFANKAVILSAGAVRSPQLLILSGVGPKPVLEKLKVEPVVIREGVGQNLHDHYDIGKATVCFSEPTKGYEDLSLQRVFQFIQDGSGPLGTSFGVESVGFFRSRMENLTTCPDPNDAETCQPDFELILQFIGQNTPLTANHYYADGITQEGLEMFYQAGRPERKDRSKINIYNKQTECLLLTPTLLHPEYRGQITLTSASPLDKPIIDLDPTKNERDMKLFGELWQMVKNITNEAFGGLSGKFVDETFPECENIRDRDSIEYGTCQAVPYIRTAWHMAGTCRLGKADDPLAVVDENFNVIGAQNLMVADGSVVPYPTSGHMLAMISALAEKAVDRLIAKSDAVPGTK
ncbi:uncharacterized protein LOC100904426 [Galendromus occidentalis]|uniref:Uncharacterized protein LOC100904426 n=1 Tax=Galendromus occidentalis TaxID=34638 RepID=A0AAJ6VZ01_9ACAR|nr:uncharacterized protein LOC100904426 [Galendromus occidentalis]